MRALFRAGAAAAGLLVASAALAGGFVVRDLSGTAPAAKAALGGEFLHRASADRLTLVCSACPGSPMIDVLLGTQSDGTEERVRSGQTRIADLETICRQRSPNCRIRRLDVSPAVGWLSTYSMGRTAGSTAIVLRQGDLLTIRSVANDETTAAANAAALVRALVPAIVGR